jgi:hypothetical protein
MIMDYIPALGFHGPGLFESVRIDDDDDIILCGANIIFAKFCSRLATHIFVPLACGDKYTPYLIFRCEECQSKRDGSRTWREVSYEEFVTMLVHES